MNLTDEQIRGLAKLEQQMDSGEIPYVIYGSSRLAVDADLMGRFGLKVGQTISDAIFRAITMAKIECLQKQISNKMLSDCLERRQLLSE